TFCVAPPCVKPTIPPSFNRAEERTVPSCPLELIITPTPFAAISPFSVGAVCVCNPDRSPAESTAETQPQVQPLYGNCQRLFLSTSRGNADRSAVMPDSG